MENVKFFGYQIPYIALKPNLWSALRGQWVIDGLTLGKLSIKPFENGFQGIPLSVLSQSLEFQELAVTLGKDQITLLDLKIQRTGPSITIQAFQNEKTIPFGYGYLNLTDQCPKGYLTLTGPPLPTFLKRIVLEGYYNQDKIIIDKATLDLGSVSIEGQGVFDLKNPRHSSFKLKSPFKIDDLPQVWPETLAPQVRKWILKNLSLGMINQLFLKIVDPQTLRFSGGFQLTNVSISYLPNMPAVQGVDGTASFNNQKITINFSKGKSEKQTLTQGNLTFHHLNQNQPFLQGTFFFNGPVANLSDILRNLSLPWDQYPPLPPIQITGHASSQLQLYLPLKANLQSSELNIEGQSHLQDINLTTSRDYAPFHLKNGNFLLIMNPKILHVEGVGNLNSAKANITWITDFSDPKASQIQITSSLHSHFLKKSILQDMIQGPFEVLLSYRPYSGKYLDLFINLTTSQIHIPFLGFEKPQHVQAHAKAQLTFLPHDTICVQGLKIEGPQLHISGNGTLSTDDILQTAHVTCHQSPYAENIKLSYTKKDQKASIFLRGQSLNLKSILTANISPQNWQWFLEPDEKIELTTDIEELYYNESSAKPIRIKGGIMGRVFSHSDSESNSELIWEKARFHGFCKKKKAPYYDHLFSITLASRSDNSKILSVQSSNAGRFLEAFGLYNELSKGSLSLKAQKASPTAPYRGYLKIQNFYLKNAPLVAKLLSLTSPTSLVQMLLQKGYLFFDQFNASFNYKLGHIILHQSCAKGLSFGFSAKGDLNTNQGTLSLKGHIIPAYLIHEILNLVPILGTLLTGGDEGGLLSAAFTLDGSIKDPMISVNPLSSLTPWFIRKFFETKTEISNER